jgi:hypothetical protein
MYTSLRASRRSVVFWARCRVLDEVFDAVLGVTDGRLRLPGAEMLRGVLDGAALCLRYRDADDARAQVGVYRWEDRELPAAAKEAAEILRRNWPRVRSLAARLSEAEEGTVNLTAGGATTARRTRSTAA